MRELDISSDSCNKSCENIHYNAWCKLMKLKNSSLELYNARNAKDFPIFTMLIKNAKEFFFYIFQYIRASALNDMKNKSKHLFWECWSESWNKTISLNSKQAQQDSNQWWNPSNQREDLKIDFEPKIPGGPT